MGLYALIMRVLRRSSDCTAHSFGLVTVVLGLTVASCGEAASEAPIRALANRGAIFQNAAGASEASIDVARIAVADLSNVRDLAVDDLMFLRETPELTTLVIGGHQIDDRAVPYFLDAKKLSSLMLLGTSVTSHGARHLTTIPLLTGISLSGDGIDDLFIESLASCANLESIALFKCRVSLASVRFARFPRLRALKIYSCPDIETEHIVEALKDTHLQSVRLAVLRCSLDQTFVQSLGGDVRMLEIINCPLSDDAVAMFSTLANLSELNLLGTQISVEGCKAIAKLSTVTDLKIGLPSAHRECLAEISRMRNVRRLELRALALSDEDVPQLGRLNGLRSLKLGPGLSPSGADALRQALPHCAITVQ